MTTVNQRELEYDCNEMFPNRWSPRALTGTITKEDLMKCFEAARWAPSSYNAQPWRFVYALKDTEAWKTLSQIPNEFNQKWCLNAAALILVIARETFEYKNKPNAHHEFDSGSAWISLSFQANKLGYHTHAMAGIEHDKAKTLLNIPEGYKTIAMVAIGKLGNKEQLPDDLKDQESPNTRKNISEFAFEGEFKADKIKDE